MPPRNEYIRTRRRGIYPVNLDSPSPDTLRTLSVDTVRWQGLDASLLHARERSELRKQYRAVVERLRRYANSCLYLKDRETLPQVIVAVTQTTQVRADRERGIPAHTFRGGSTLVVDLSVPEVKYRIVKRITSDSRRERTAEFVRDTAADPLRALFFGPDRREPFAALHSLAEHVDAH